MRKVVVAYTNGSQTLRLATISCHEINDGFFLEGNALADAGRDAMIAKGMIDQQTSADAIFRVEEGD